MSMKEEREFRDEIIFLVYGECLVMEVWNVANLLTQQYVRKFYIMNSNQEFLTEDPDEARTYMKKMIEDYT